MAQNKPTFRAADNPAAPFNPTSIGPHPALFLDRDGTIIVEQHYLNDPHLVQIEDGVVEGLQAAQTAGYKLIIVTNQSGIARGKIKMMDYLAVHRRMLDLLSRHHIVINGTYYCPHHPNHGPSRLRKSCACRKPKPGMIQHAIADHHIDPRRSVMIGDRHTDCEAGRAAGIRAIHIQTGHGPDEPIHHGYETAANLGAAIHRILTA